MHKPGFQGGVTNARGEGEAHAPRTQSRNFPLETGEHMGPNGRRYQELKRVSEIADGRKSAHPCWTS